MHGNFAVCVRGDCQRQNLDLRTKVVDGILTGKVVNKQHGPIILAVTKVGEIWRHSKAENAKSLVGSLR